MNVSYQSFRGDKRYQLPNIKLSKSEPANCNNLNRAHSGRVILKSLHPPRSKEGNSLPRSFCLFLSIGAFHNLSTLLPFLQNAVFNPFRL